jgi:acyl dehydratase
MALVEIQGVEGMQLLLGQEIGPSEWRAVTQEDIDTFARVSGDDQWIHVDVERAKTESPFGTTIAHGNLTLSLVDGFRKEMISSTGFALGVNYGWNKIRFPAPVPVDSRVRAKAEVASVDEVGGGWWQMVTRFTLEVEGNEKPCFVGDSVTRVMAPDQLNSVTAVSGIRGVAAKGVPSGCRREDSYTRALDGRKEHRTSLSSRRCERSARAMGTGAKPACQHTGSSRGHRAVGGWTPGSSARRGGC